ncbi:MAG TPA: hypothetical protein DF984_07355 [Anaerolineaceae bacterium]|jgi:uncharacterized phage-associated protein|nr:hypothetical protein [Anaerolineaceae bacterium]
MLYPRFNVAKATEATSLLLSWHGGRMSRIKVLKLLYLADRQALKDWERPITFDEYYSMKNGQVLSGVLDLINNNIKDQVWNDHIEQDGEYYIKLHNEPVTLRKLNKAEYKLLKSIYDRYGKMNRFDLGDLTKKFPEYKSTNSRRRTDIKEILDDIYGEQGAQDVLVRLDDQAKLEIALRE